MKLLDHISEDKLTHEIIVSGSRDVMRRWRSTAHDSCPHKFSQIEMLSRAYDECSDFELKPAKVIGYLSSLLDTLENDSQRQAVLNAEAIHLKL